MELYNRVRRACHVDGMSKREAARLFGIDRKTVSKILQHSVPPGYRRSKVPARPKLDPFIPIIDRILEDDKSKIKKQRHTAKRIHTRLRDEHGFTGGITIVTDYVREKKRRSKEVFVPLSHAPGHAQVDFGETLGVIGGVGYGRRNFMVPAPRFESFEALNAWLEEQCLRRQNDIVRGHSATIGERLLCDLDALMALVPVPYDACEKVSTRATSISMVRYRSNDYSVPVAYAHHEVQVRGYVHEVVIGCGAEVIARHKRSYDKADMIYDPMHFLPLLEQKVGALDQAAPLQGWDLPDAFATLHRLLEARMGKPGKREYVQVLRLLDSFEIDHVHGAVRQALDLGAIGYDAVKHLVLCRIERRPPKLDLDVYPFLPAAQVETTKAASYKVLMSEATP